MSSVRTAISLPKSQFEKLENLCKKMGLSRSGLFQKLIADWFRSMEEKRLVEQYVRGYQRRPEGEKPDELEAMAHGLAESLQAEKLDWK